jgi:hypothetical protein
MSATAPTRPAAGEFAEYYGRYISRVPDGDVRAQLERQIGATAAYIKSRGDAWAMSRYAPGKWSVKEVVGHLADAERVFSYRALRFARGDAKPLQGFDENAYVPAAQCDSRGMADLLDEFAAVRSATVSLVRSFDDAAWARRGIASDNPVTVRAIAYIMAGHELHHLAILRERYV